MIDLIKKCKSKDEKALCEMIKIFEPYIYKISVSFYVKGYEVEDFIQLGKLGLIKAIDRFDLNKDINFKAYAFTVIRNEVREVVRKYLGKGENFESSLNIKLANDNEIVELIESDENLEEQIIFKENIWNLKKAINRLSKEEKEIIDWYYIKYKPLKEFAKLKNLTLSAVNKRKERTLKKLRKLMENGCKSSNTNL